MAHERLGLFDTPPDRREVRLSLAVVGLLLAALFFAFPLRGIQLGEVKAFVPLIDAAMLFSELIIATLLYAQAIVFRSRALTVLASGYVFVAVILIPHALTFPGAFATNGLLGAGINTTAWLAVFRRLTFPLAVIVYVLLKSADSTPRTDSNWPAVRVFECLIGAIILAALAALLTTLGHDLLPPIFRNYRDTVHTNLVIVNLVTILLTTAAMVLLFRQKKSVLDVWLLVALSGWIFQSLLNVTLLTRFTVGWYGLNVMTLASSFIVMLALIAETSWLYARLALLTAARNHEREARLMSMGAVTAAISHEVGQPLTAVSLNASAGLHWLTQSRPDVSKAITSLQAISDDTKRTFDVIKSIRAMFGKGGGPISVFRLNDLVRETVALMDRELAGARVTLELALDEAVPPIRADRVQIQRVVINLITNAMEALGTGERRTRRSSQSRPRCIRIRSANLNGQGVRLSVIDTGAGIAADELERIFDPFYTTKASGRGLGLPLCRTIVEDHHGRIWASQDDVGGAIFHFELPSSLSAETSKARSPRT